MADSSAPFGKEQDKGYRRGFDQGVAALAYALGMENDALRRSAFKRRVRDFRVGRLKSAESLTPTGAERQELLNLIPTDQEATDHQRSLGIDSNIRQLFLSLSLILKYKLPLPHANGRRKAETS